MPHCDRCEDGTCIVHRDDKCEPTEHAAHALERNVGPVCEHCGTPLVRVELRIENTYALYPSETTEAKGWIEAPVGDPHAGGWAYDNLHPFTGVGHTDGDSWYDVEIVASSDPALVGMTFEFGY